jgi:hypothetical protein
MGRIKQTARKSCGHGMPRHLAAKNVGPAYHAQQQHFMTQQQHIPVPWSLPRMHF